MPEYVYNPFKLNFLPSVLPLAFELTISPFPSFQFIDGGINFAIGKSTLLYLRSRKEELNALEPRLVRSKTAYASESQVPSLSSSSFSRLISTLPPHSFSVSRSG